MLDTRSQIAKETADHLLNVTFAPPGTWTEARCEEHALDIRAELRKLMPHGSNVDALKAWGLGLRLQLKRQMRHQTWPTLRELREAADSVQAIRAQSESHARDDQEFAEGHEHPGVDWWIGVVEAWIRKFDNWPYWANGPYGREAARRMVEQGWRCDTLLALGAEFLDDRRFDRRANDDSAA